MGITISYRGSIADLDRIEDFEDRVIDLSLELGSNAQIWRSVCDDDPRRVVRGVILDLYPGQETTSLLISPEGWLINLSEIQAAETGELGEPPWCFVKTQFGPVEGHVAIVELLACLKNEFIPNLEVRDEGNYWESRDVDVLRQTFARLQAAIEGLADGLRRHGLSSEAAEDPGIVAARIERVARLVHRTLSRPPEHPPVRFDDDSEFDDGLGGSESEWDAFYKENRRKQERIKRAIEERMARGEDTDGVFEAALRDEGIIDLPGEPSFSDAVHEFEESLESEDDEPWRESLPEAVRDDDAEFDAEFDADDDAEDEPFGSDRHPLQRQSMDLMLRLHDLFKDFEGPRTSHVDILHYSAGEIMGGLAQALGTRDMGLDFGLNVVQLKRALRGAAFAFGALISLRAEGILDETVFAELRDTIKTLEADILDELRRLRDEGQSD